MFGYLPESTKDGYAATEKEAQEWTEATLSGQKTNARRPPELSTRDNVARSIYTEVKAGRGTEHGGVFLDISYQDPDRVKKKLPSMYHQFKELADVDITKQPMEVGPTMHYIMGGIRVDAETGESRVPGLFAAGECSGGMHGSNRLGGNSLSDLLVFGCRSGMGAAQYAQKLGRSPNIDNNQIEAAIAELEEPFKRSDGFNPYDIQKTLHDIMGTHVGIFREKSELEIALSKLHDLNGKVKMVKSGGDKSYNPGWHLCRDLKNMMICAESITKSALSRPESRGAHSRLDYPDTNADWGKVNSSISKKGEDMQLDHTPAPVMPSDLQDLFKKKEPANA
jgi:succinate dehydrogenase / fumarate reductase flavoprotein subunit